MSNFWILENGEPLIIHRLIYEANKESNDVHNSEHHDYKRQITNFTPFSINLNIVSLIYSDNYEYGQGHMPAESEENREASDNAIFTINLFEVFQMSLFIVKPNIDASHYQLGQTHYEKVEELKVVVLDVVSGGDANSGGCYHTNYERPNRSIDEGINIGLYGHVITFHF